MKHLAVIPARSGSKGLKDKNIKLLAGKPMVAYAIEAAREAGIFDCVHVSTDSEKYRQIAQGHGADVPFLRSDELSGDGAGSWDVVRWTLERYRELGQEFQRVTLLQPTSPLRRAEDIRGALALMEERRAEAVVSVCEMDHSPLWSNVLPEDGCMDGFLPLDLADARQELATYYRVNGAIYMVNVPLLRQEPIRLYGEKTYAYRMSRERSVDIDNALDFAMAETIMGREGSVDAGNARDFAMAAALMARGEDFS